MITDIKALRRTLLICTTLLISSMYLRLSYIFQASSLASFRSLIPGLDEDLYWRAASNLRVLDMGEINFELLGCSAPLHVLWLGFLQYFVGDDIHAVRLIHITLASLRYLLMWWLFQKFSSRPVVSAFMTFLILIQPAAVVFDASLLKSVNDLNLITIAFALAAKLYFTNSRIYRESILIGLILGMLVFNQLSTVLFFVPFASFILLTNRPFKERILSAAMVATLAISAYLMFHSYAQMAPSSKYSMVSHSGINLYLGLFKGADVQYKSIDGIRNFPFLQIVDSRMVASLYSGKDLGFAEANTYYKNLARKEIVDDPMRILILFGRRAAAYFNQHEYKGVYYIAHLQEHIPALRMLPNSFGILMLLATLGCCYLFRRAQWGPLALALGVMLAIVATGVLIFVFSRFRLPMLISLGILASFSYDYFKALASTSFLNTSRFVEAGFVTAIAALSYWPLPEATIQEFMEKARGNEFRAQVVQQDRGSIEMAAAGSAQRFDALIRASEYSKLCKELQGQHVSGALGKVFWMHLLRCEMWAGKQGFLNELRGWSHELTSEMLMSLPIDDLDRSYLSKQLTGW